MLILTRKPGEIIRIGDDIHILFISVQGNQLRIGVKAPKDVSVHREEIWLRINKEKNQDASA